MPESIYKTMILRGRIEQIPAHLDWSRQIGGRPKRRSSMRIAAAHFATVLQGFIFRPFMFFILPGLLLLAFVALDQRLDGHPFHGCLRLPGRGRGRQASAAVALAYQQSPHTFIVGLLSLMLAIQLISLGVLAMQSKSYYEEIFFLGTSIKRAVEGRPDVPPSAALRRVNIPRGRDGPGSGPATISCVN